MRGWLYPVLLTLAAHASAADVTSKGSAPLEGQSRSAARLQAIRAAERDAAESAGLEIVGSEASPGLQTIQTQGRGKLGTTRVTDETSRDGVLTVKAQVGVNPPAGGCGASHYRKKLAVAAFTVAHAEQAADIHDAGQGYALELLDALAASQHYLTRNAVAFDVFPNPAQAADPRGDAYAISAVGSRLDAQFVVAGAIQDLTLPDTVYRRGANELIGLFGAHLEPVERQVRIDLYLFDSLSGNVLLQKTYATEATGEVYFSNGGVPLRSRTFQDSDLGEAVQELIGQQVADVAAKVDCLPLMERIVRVEKPYIYINAGSSSNLQVGDSLAVYHQLDKPMPGVYYQSTRLVGYPEEMKTTATITQVQPSFAIGKLELGSAAVSPMDLVRSW